MMILYGCECGDSMIVWVDIGIPEEQVVAHLICSCDCDLEIYDLLICEKVA